MFLPIFEPAFCAGRLERTKRLRFDVIREREAVFDSGFAAMELLRLIAARDSNKRLIWKGNAFFFGEFLAFSYAKSSNEFSGTFSAAAD